MNKFLKNFLRLTVLSVLVACVVVVTACSSDPVNLLKNNLFKERITNDAGKLVGIAGWDIASPKKSDLNISIEPGEVDTATAANAVLRITIPSSIGERSYLTLSQKIKVRKNTVYCFSYQVSANMSVDTGTQSFGVYPTILEDKALEMPEMHTDSDFAAAACYSPTRVSSSSSAYTDCKFYFSSNNHTELTVALWMGAPQSLTSGTVAITKVSVTPQYSSTIDMNKVYKVSTNNVGYYDSSANSITLAVLCCVLFTALFTMCVFWLSSALATRGRKKISLQGNIEIPDFDMNIIETAEQQEGVEEAEIEFDKEKLAEFFSSDENAEVPTALQQADEPVPQGQKDVGDVGEVVVGNAVPGKIKTKLVDACNYYIHSPALLLATVLVLGFVVRLVLSLLVRGDRESIALASDYFKTLSSYGLSEFYSRHSAGSGVYIGVGSLYFLGLSQVLMSLFNSSVYSPFGVFLLRLPSICFDVLAAYYVYRMAVKYVNKRFALAACALYIFNPAVFLASSALGGADSLYALMLLLTLYAILEKKSLLSFLFYTFAIIVSPKALYLAPVFLVYQIFRLVMSVKYAYKHRKKGAFKGEGSFVWRFFAYSLGAFVLVYLVSMPAMWTEIIDSFFYPYQNIYFSLADFNRFSNNAFNFFAMLGRNGIDLSDDFPVMLLSMLFFAIISVVVAVVFLAKRNRSYLLLIGSYSIFSLVIFLVDMSPSGFIPALLLLLAAIVITKERRAILLYGIISLLCIINQTLVLHFSLSVNNLSDFLISEANPLYVGTAMLDNTVAYVLSIVFSALMFIAFIYFTLVLLQISLSGKRRKLLPPDGKCPFCTLKSLIK